MRVSSLQFICFVLLAISLLSLVVECKKPVRMYKREKPESCRSKVQDGDLVGIFYNIKKTVGGEDAIGMAEDVLIVGTKALRNTISGIHVGILGACKGEKRFLKIESTSAFGAGGWPEKGIEPGRDVDTMVIVTDIFKKKNQVTEDDAENLQRYVKKPAPPLKA